jgi:hypothetical protein
MRRLVMLRVVMLVLSLGGCGSTPPIARPCPAPPRPSPAVPPAVDPPQCASDFWGPAPEVVRVPSRAALAKLLAPAVPVLASDVVRQIDDAHGPAFLIERNAGSEHGGDGNYYRISGVFELGGALVVVKDVGMTFETIPYGKPPPRLLETSAIEVLGGTIGHVRVATSPAVDHFIDLSSAKYMGGYVEGGAPLVRWTLDEEGATGHGATGDAATGDACTVYWH